MPLQQLPVNGSRQESFRKMQLYEIQHTPEQKFLSFSPIVRAL